MCPFILAFAQSSRHLHMQKSGLSAHKLVAELTPWGWKPSFFEVNGNISVDFNEAKTSSHDSNIIPSSEPMLMPSFMEFKEFCTILPMQNRSQHQGLSVSMCWYKYERSCADATLYPSLKLLCLIADISLLINSHEILHIFSHYSPNSVFFHFFKKVHIYVFFSLGG